MTTLLPFQLIQPDVGAGSPLPDSWRPLARLSAPDPRRRNGRRQEHGLAHLAEFGLDYALLPDRRIDRSPDHLRHAGPGSGPIQPVTDRGLRFDYTRRYREQYRGGMAHALAQVSASPVLAGRLLLFDGLRGANEVQHAAQALPQARFAMLEAPDAVRVQRLLGRRDAFDTIRVMPSGDLDATGPQNLADLGLPEAAGLLPEEDTAHLIGWVRQGAISADDLRAKLRIVLEERRSYDPAATRAALEQAAPSRALFLDTVALSPSEVATAIAGWLQA